MYDLHYWPTPNGHKITLFLEESGLTYKIVPVDIRSGAQFQPDFLKISPNNRMPALVDHETGVSLFESGAILLYLADKHRMFIPEGAVGRAEVLQWLFWQMGGLGPMMGQANHFIRYAEPIDYAIDRWRNFLDRWPDVHALARAPEADILSAWAGLGYYARARNLIAAARAISEAGRFPETSAELRRLPGIGPYTAAAVAAIAFGEQVAAIDSNVARVAARLFAISTPLPNGRPALEQALAPHVPAARPGDFTQALMDLGSSICTPRKPRCLLCPLASMCKARALGEPESYPDRPPRKERPLRQGLAWWIECGDTVALVRRPSRGLLGGMMALPGSDWTSDPPPSPPDLEGEWAMLGEVSHGFTHFELRLSIATTRLAEPLPDLLGQKLIWTARSQLSDAGLPTLFARAAELALAATLQPLETR